MRLFRMFGKRTLVKLHRKISVSKHKTVDIFNAFTDIWNESKSNVNFFSQENYFYIFNFNMVTQLIADRRPTINGNVSAFNRLDESTRMFWGALL